MATTDTIAIDPVCGMKVDTAKAVHSQYNGQSYCFCCPNCQKKFELDSAGVLQARAEKDAAKKLASEPADASCCGGQPKEKTGAKLSASDSQAIYTCPMHLQIEQIGPGDCPNAGATRASPRVASAPANKRSNSRTYAVGSRDGQSYHFRRRGDRTAG